MDNDPDVEERGAVRLGPAERGGMVLLAAGLAVVFAVASRLEPSPSGIGTHQQLGLPPCHFAVVTGRPCPTCGMTTAFAWLVRGRFIESLSANPAGAILATACVALVPWLVAGAARGRPWFFKSLEGPLIGLLTATVALSLLSWMVRLLST